MAPAVLQVWPQTINYTDELNFSVFVSPLTIRPECRICEEHGKMLDSATCSWKFQLLFIYWCTHLMFRFQTRVLNLFMSAILFRSIVMYDLADAFSHGVVRTSTIMKWMILHPYPTPDTHLTPPSTTISTLTQQYTIPYPPLFHPSPLPTPPLLLTYSRWLTTPSPETACDVRANDICVEEVFP